MTLIIACDAAIAFHAKQEPDHAAELRAVNYYGQDAAGRAVWLVDAITRRRAGGTGFRRWYAVTLSGSAVAGVEECMGGPQRERALRLTMVQMDPPAF